MTPRQEAHQLRTIDGIALDKESTSPPKTLSEVAAKDSKAGAKTSTEELPPLPESDLSKSGLAESATPKKPAVPPADRIVLTLADARASALEANLDLRVQEVNPAIARQAISAEAGKFESTFRTTYQRERLDPPPGILFGGVPDTTFDRFTNTITQPLTTGGQFQVLHNVTKSDINVPDVFDAVNTDLGVTYRQPLLRGFGYQVNTASIQVARAQSGIADTQSKLTAIRVLADVERDYWNLYAARQLLDIALEQLDLAKKQKVVTDKLVAAGVFTSVEQLVAESGVLVRENAAIQAETNVRVAERDLKRIMQRPDAPVNSATKLELATEPNPLGLEFDREELADRAVHNRMEIVELTLQLLSQSIQRQAQQNATLPSLDLTANLDTLGLDTSYSKSMDVLSTNNFGDRAVGVALEVPLSGNVTAQAQLRTVELQMMQTRLQQDQVSVQVTQEVYDAIDRVEQNWQRIVATRQAQFAAERAYDGQVRLQEAGRQTVTDVLVALQNLGDAKAQAVQAITDYQTAKVDLAVAAGTMLGYGQVDWSPCCGPQSPLPNDAAQQSDEEKVLSGQQIDDMFSQPPGPPVRTNDIELFLMPNPSIGPDFPQT
ncbi:MAG TPA: TolC family protein [Lacipirellulaceae bacterium]|jgi:outer membrane protein TolC|nr:TolC family protein [Lacipirellulaceae bacterium]